MFFFLCFLVKSWHPNKDESVDVTRGIEESLEIVDTGKQEMD